MSTTSLIARDDTFFGVCEGLGEDLGFNANWLRIGFALALFWNPLAAGGAYAAAGLLVAATRLAVREPKPAPLPDEAEAEAKPLAEQAELPLAA